MSTKPSRRRADEGLADTAFTLAHDDRFTRFAVQPATFGFEMFEASLHSWRSGLDAMREMIRTQQDATLSLARGLIVRGELSDGALATDDRAPDAQSGERRA